MSHFDDLVMYANPMVIKPWGMEQEVFNNGIVSIWHLHIKKGQRTSIHLHERKTTALVVLTGKVEVHAHRVKVYGPHSMIKLDPCDIHQTVALEDSWVLEMETPCDKNDLVRLSDVYGRSGLPYETATIPFDFKYAFPSKEFPE